MTIYQPKTERAKVQRAQQGQSIARSDRPEMRLGVQAEIYSPGEKALRAKTVEVVQAPNGAAPINTGILPDLNREGANMLELLTRQSTSITTLSIFSKSAQTVLRQF